MASKDDFKKKLDPEFIGVDPLKESYRESIIEHPDRPEAIRQKNIALLCIDMQYLDAAEGYGVFADVANSEIPIEAQQYYFDSLKKVVLPNVKSLQECFRKNNLEVIHIRIQSLTQDGRDRSNGHKKLGLLAPPGSKEAKFLEEVAPADDEIIINKTSSGVFNSSNLHYILKNLEIDSLWVTGVYTEECISTTVRDGSDLGYFVTLIEDGCTSVTPERHDFTIATLKDRYTRIISTNEAIKEIEIHIAQ
jgi:nicotinamidase-related amidase